uniref:ABC transporter ATP-binding protein n=1 Tax=Mesocestoides corti TaxID=53468 RepID=A0A5K3F8J7_MESCO
NKIVSDIVLAEAQNEAGQAEALRERDGLDEGLDTRTMTWLSKPKRITVVLIIAQPGHI